MKDVLDASSNVERTGDRDLQHSNRMREPGTYVLNTKRRRPGFEDLRSFDDDTRPQCHKCGLPILIWNVTRIFSGGQSVRYILALADELGIGCYNLEKTDVPLHKWFQAVITDVRNPEKVWRFFNPIDFNQWVEKQYWEHKRKIHGELNPDPPSVYGDM